MRKRRTLTALDYQKKLAKIETDEERLMTKLLRVTNRLLAARDKAKYLRRRISELSD